VSIAFFSEPSGGWCNWRAELHGGGALFLTDRGVPRGGSGPHCSHRWEDPPEITARRARTASVNALVHVVAQRLNCESP
jgi:hypothetical protein